MQQACIISQEAINHLVATKRDQLTPQQQNLEYYTMPVIHPVTGEHITSYRCLMQHPLTSKVWMTVFRKDFGGMTQGDEKTVTKGTNAMFVMNPGGVPNNPKNQPPTYAKVVIAYRPQNGRSQSCASHSWRKFN
jgi:hypothetical protein